MCINKYVVKSMCWAKCENLYSLNVELTVNVPTGSILVQKSSVQFFYVRQHAAESSITMHFCTFVQCTYHITFILLLIHSYILHRHSEKAKNLYLRIHEFSRLVRRRHIFFTVGYQMKNNKQPKMLRS